MRFYIHVAALSVAASMTLITGCSDNSALSPKLTAPQGRITSLMLRIPAALSPIGLLRVNVHPRSRAVGFNSCPATGALTYISDYNNNEVDIYFGGTFSGQSPCGVITASSGLSAPEGLFIRPGTRDLFVANTGGGNVLAFHRGLYSAPFHTYTDASGQYPADVAVASNGTVIASNIFAIPPSTELGSISTWHLNSSFVGNYPMVNDFEGLWVTVQTGAATRIFYNDIDATTGGGVVYTGTCPNAVCGAFSPTPATTNTAFPGGLRSRSADNRLIQFDQLGGVGGARWTYNDVNPLFPGAFCSISGVDPVGFDMNAATSRIYYADAATNNGVEMTFGCSPVGTVPGNVSELMIGVAHDPPEAL